MSAILFVLLGIIVLLLFSALFSGSETALFSLSRSQIKRMENGTAGEKSAWSLLKNPQQLLASILVGNMFVNNLLTLLTAAIVTKASNRLLTLFGANTSSQIREIAAIVLNIVIVTPLLMVFGELTPKTIAYHHGQSIAKLVSRPLHVIGSILTPLVWIFKILSSAMQALCGLKNSGNWDMLTRADVSESLTASVKDGFTSRPTAEILERILKFDDITASEFMIPRTNIEAIDDKTPLHDAFTILRDSSHRYIPVYHENLDDIWGVVAFTDYPKWLNSKQADTTLASFRDALNNPDAFQRLPVHAVSFVLGNTKIATIISDKSLKTGVFIVVVDEYGETMGVITMDAIFEEIIGCNAVLANDPDRMTPRVKGGWFCSGMAHLRTISEYTGESYDDTDSDTAGGLIMEKLEHLPKRGEYIDTEHFRFIVLQMQGNSVRKIAISPLLQTKENPADTDGKDARTNWNQTGKEERK